MSVLADLEAKAMRLPEGQRATLAAHLLESLPAICYDEDEGVAEAMRRDKDLELDPSSGMSLEELRKSLGR